MESLEERYNSTLRALTTSPGHRFCAAELRKRAPIDRTELFEKAYAERLELKQRELQRIYEASDGNWSQTMFVMYLTALGDHKNREAFTELARRVGYNPIQHERASLLSVEALLLGTSGLLANYPEDGYIVRLKEEFAHLAYKYDIEPMNPRRWILREIRPYNHPAIRLAQAAVFLSAGEPISARCLGIRTRDELFDTFCVEASEYWRTHDTPGSEGDSRRKGIGRDKALVIGINMVAQVQFAYGRAMGQDDAFDRLTSFMTSLEAEDNALIREWVRDGFRPENAQDSQALLQLSKIYCRERRCEKCLLGRKILELAVKTHPAGAK